MVKCLPTMWETRVRSLGREDPLEKEMATHSSNLAGKSHGWRSLVGYSPRGRKESDITKRLHFHFLSFQFYSYLSNNFIVISDFSLSFSAYSLQIFAYPIGFTFQR